MTVGVRRFLVQRLHVTKWGFETFKRQITIFSFLHNIITYQLIYTVSYHFTIFSFGKIRLLLYCNNKTNNIVFFNGFFDTLRQGLSFASRISNNDSGGASTPFCILCNVHAYIFDVLLDSSHHRHIGISVLIIYQLSRDINVQDGNDTELFLRCVHGVLRETKSNVDRNSDRPRTKHTSRPPKVDWQIVIYF